MGYYIITVYKAMWYRVVKLTAFACAGFFHSDLWAREFPKIQIRTVGEMLSGNGFELPPRPADYQPAQRVRRPQGHQARLGEPS